MPTARLTRRAALAGLALGAALTLASCSADAPAGDPASASVDAEANSDATLGGTPIDVAAGEISNDLEVVLSSSADEFGDVGVDLLLIYTDTSSLMFVDPAQPDFRFRAQFHDPTWSAPMRTRRGESPAPLPLDAIDPATLRSALEAAPALLGIDAADLSHVSISPDADGQAEYLVALAFGTSLGRVTFDARGEAREIKPPL